MKRITVLSMVLCLAFAGLAHARTYKIAVVSWAGWAPCHVADAKGFWKTEGVNVQVITTTDPLQTINLFRQKLVDLAFDMLGSVIGMHMDGLPVSIVAETDWSHGGDKIIVKKDADMSKLSNLPVGVYFDKPSVTYFLGQYLSKVGVKLAYTRVIEMESDTLTDNFITGLFGIIVNYDPAALRAERQGNGKVVATSATYEGSIPEGIMALNDVLKTIPHEDLVKILKGWIRAAEWVNNPANWKEYMDIMNARTFPNDPPYSEKDLKEMADAVRVHDKEMLMQRNMTEGGLYAYLGDLKTFLRNNRRLVKNYEVSDMFNNRAIMDALAAQ